MYHVVEDLQVVRRFGGWATDTFHSYLWESHEPMRGVAERMARDETELTTPRQGLGAGAHDAAGTSEEVARPRGAAAGRPRGGAGSPRGRQSSGPASAALTGTVAAAVVGSAAGQPLTALAATQGRATNAVVFLIDALSFVWVVDLSDFLLGVLATLCLVMVMGACVGCVLRATRAEAGPRRSASGETDDGTQTKKPVKKGKAKRQWMEAGIQGPVHYDGKRYVHKAQGFSRGDEVSHHLPTKPHTD